MAQEIERKFLVTSDAWRALAKPVSGTRLRQGYIASQPGRTVRVRIAGENAFLTIKGPADPSGLSRDEFEYPIPVSDAEQMLDRLCEKPQIRKVRYHVPAGTAGLVFEVDVFEAENAGLVVAEIELADAAQTFAKPAWLGQEVTADPRYRNSNLVRAPYTTWASK